MRAGLRHFSAESIEWLKKAAESGTHTRCSMARTLCELEQWKNTRGDLCVASARKALPKIADKAGFTLPSSRPMVTGISCGAGSVEAETGFPDNKVSLRIEQLGDISLEIAEDKSSWRSMMASHHPRGWSRTPGKQICYWIKSSRCGVLGGIGFCAASWHQKARDERIGWSQRARVNNLEYVVNNHRFLLLPGVEVKNLASFVLGAAVKRMRSDWKEKHGVSPLLAYSYISSDREGTSYKAAGWEMCDEKTSGKPPGRREAVERKTVWTRELCAGALGELCEERREEMGRVPTPFYAEDADWAQMEYGRSSYPDGRVRELIIRMGRAWELRCGAGLPVIFPDRNEQRAAYRLLSSDNVEEGDITEPHAEALVERVRRERRDVVLAVQDTTTINYSNLNSIEGLVSIGGKGEGLFVHMGLAVTESRRPLGVYELNATVRNNGEEVESERWRRGLGKAQELERACEGVRVVTVCDREGDMWKLMADAKDRGAGLAVRSKKGHGRRVAVGEKSVDLWEHMDSLCVLGTKKVEVRARGGKGARKRRVAEVEIRAERVKLLPTAAESRNSAEPLEMVAVSAKEKGGSSREPLHWVLLCTEGDSSFGNAKRVVKWYEARWTIEEYFRVLKTGTRIEDRGLDHADDLRKCLAFDAVTAVRVFDLERLARDNPRMPAIEALERLEIITLYLLLERRNMVSARPPPEEVDMERFIIDLGRYAGFIPSKRQPLPGTLKIWQGYELFKAGYELAMAVREHLPH